MSEVMPANIPRQSAAQARGSRDRLATQWDLPTEGWRRNTELTPLGRGSKQTTLFFGDNEGDLV